MSSRNDTRADDWDGNQGGGAAHEVVAAIELSKALPNKAQTLGHETLGWASVQR